MKKLISILILTFISLSIFGCSKTPINEAEKNPNESNDTSYSKLYCDVIDAAFKEDSALNSEIKYVSIDTESIYNFSDIDKKFLFDYINKKYNVTTLDMNFKELVSEGYITDSYFTEGVLFKIDSYTKTSDTILSFTCSKFRSGLGSNGFTVDATKENNNWVIKKFEMTWIS